MCGIVATITPTAANQNELSRKSLSAVGVAHKSKARACTQMLVQVRIESCLLAKSRLLSRLPHCCLLLRAALFSCLLESTKVLPTYAGITFKIHLSFLLTHKRCSFATFTDPPEIIRKPQNQGVRVGGVASFYCAARGDPPPSIVWRKNGKKVSGKL